MAIQRTLGPFNGLMTSMDPRDIPEGYAQDMQNVRIEDGKIRLRYGFSTLAAGSASAVYGFSHLVGYNTSTYAKVEEFVSFETIGGNTRAYSVHPSTYAKTEIKNGVSSVNLNASDWNAVSFGSNAYFLNPNNTTPIYQHAIADATSLKAVAGPSSPTTALRHTLVYDWAGGNGGYAKQAFTSFDPTNAAHVAFTGKGNNTGSSLLSDGTLKLAMNTAGTAYATTVTLDFSSATGSTLDFSYNDIFQFTIRFADLTIDPASLKITFTNADGSPLSWGAEIDTHWEGDTVVVRAEFKGKTRTDWDNIDQIKFDFTITATPIDNPYIYIYPFIIGMVDCTEAPVISGPGARQFSYSYYDSVNQWESDMYGTWSSGYLTISNDKLLGYNPARVLPGLGVWVKIYSAASPDAAVDKVRIYVLAPVVQSGQTPWGRVTEQNDATTTSYFRMTAAEVIAITDRFSPASARLSRVKAACPFKGWMVWLMKGGYQNIQHSRVGVELNLASDLDQPDDDNRGATFSLADNFADEPICAHQAGDALIIFGDRGIYAQVGDRPSQMTPPKKIPDSMRIANQFAACRGRDSEGNPGVFFVSYGCEGVYFVQVDQSFDGNQGFRLVEVSTAIRGLIKSYASTSTVRIGRDEHLDAVWIIDTDDAFVLRRPSLIDGQRQWERYNFSGEAWSYLAFTSDYYKRVIGSDGDIVQVEYSSPTSYYTTYKGTDAGCYWQSKDYDGPMRRIGRIIMLPSFPVGGTNGPSVTLTIGGVTEGGTSTSGKVPNVDAVSPASTPRRAYRFGYKCAGQHLNLKINFNSFSQGGMVDQFCRELLIEEIPIGQRLLR